MLHTNIKLIITAFIDLSSIQNLMLNPISHFLPNFKVIPRLLTCI